MRNSELEGPQNDLDVEITSLDEGKPAGGAPRSLRLNARQHKRPLTVVAIVVMTLAIVLIVVSTSAIRGLAVRFLALPTPTPTRALYPGEDLFYVQADPAWGHLTIDGHAIIRLPIVGASAPLRLSRGRHVLVWSAEPFQPQRCILTMPANYPIDTCIDHSTVQTQPGVTASIVEFQESLTMLAPDSRAPLIQAVQEELDARQSTVIVQKGELYALSPSDSVCQSTINEAHCYAVAEQPLISTLNFRLDTNPSSKETCLVPEPGCTFLHESCYTFCSQGDNTADIWDVLAPVLSLWTFQTQSCMAGRYTSEY